MRYLLFGAPAPTYKVAILIKSAAFTAQALREHYVAPLQTAGIPAETVIGYTLKYDEHNKCTAKQAKEYLAGKGVAIRL